MTRPCRRASAPSCCDSLTATFRREHLDVNRSCGAENIAATLPLLACRRRSSWCIGGWLRQSSSESVARDVRADLSAALGDSATAEVRVEILCAPSLPVQICRTGVGSITSVLSAGGAQ